VFSSIYLRLFVPVIGGVVVLICLLLILAPMRLSDMLEKNFSSELDSIARALSVSIRSALEQEDLSILSGLRVYMEQNENLSFAAIFQENDSGEILLAKFPPDFPLGDTQELDELELLTASIPITGDRVDGRVVVGSSREILKNKIRRAQSPVYFAFAVLFTVLLAMYFSLRDGVVDPMRRSASVAEEIGRGKLDLKIEDETKTKEAMALSHALKGMQESLAAKSEENEKLLSGLEQTVRERTEQLDQALRETENVAQELSDLINTADAPIFGIDTEGRIVEWNKATEVLTSYEKKEVVGIDFVGSLITEEARPTVKRVLASALRGKGIANFETLLLTKEGFLRIVLLNATARRDTNGEIVGVIGVGKDITELREKEKSLRQAQKMKAVGQLTGGVAHDFNNLLNIISGNLRFLKQELGEVDSDVSELLDDALSAVDDGSNLTGSLLAFSRKRELNPEILNVCETLEKLERLFTRTIAGNIEMRIEIPDTKLFINVDSSELDNAILNLVINARDAIEGDGAIVLKASRCVAGSAGESGSDGSGNIRLEVIDDGCGIAVDDLPFIFDPFYSTKEVGKGSGLGLSTVYGFAAQSGGKCVVSSEVGVGTTVSLHFPESEPILRNEALPKPREPKGPESGTVLIVEDEPRVRRVTANDLRSFGYSTLEAENANAAKSILKSGQEIDLLLTDVLMPGGTDGYALGAWTAENFPRVSIMLLSGYTGQREDGVDTARQFPLIKKPYDPWELRTAISGLLDSKANGS